MDEASIAPGLLVAMPQLLDPNFRRAVVLVVHHDENGTFGVVLNRPTEITAPNLCQSLGIEWRGASQEPIDWGGPVQPQTGWVLFDERIDVEGAGDLKRLGEGVCFAGSMEVLRRVAQAPPPRFRLLLGYAGWGPGQLEGEISEGAWLVAPLRSDVVFEVAPERMWNHVVRSLGIEPATLVATRGVH